MYVEALIGRDTVDTIPPATMDAFRDHGSGDTRRHRAGCSGRPRAARRAGGHGVSLKEVTDELVKDGVQQFADAFDKLFGAIAKRRRTLLGGRARHPGDRAGLPGDEGCRRR